MTICSMPGCDRPAIPGYVIADTGAPICKTCAWRILTTDWRAEDAVVRAERATRGIRLRE